MGGAVIMAAQAASRSGAGKVTVLTKDCHLSALLSSAPNIMTILKKENSQKIFENKTVVAIGCGLGKSAWSKKLFHLTLKSELPKIIDADALNLLSLSKEKFNLNNTIITPHVGEAARLLNISPNEIQKNRESAVKKLYEKYRAITVLKGKGTLIYDGKEIYQCSKGNPGMATAGMGDILSGIIAGLLAQNLNLKNSAILGVEIHAQAGDLVAKMQGEIGMSPCDLLINIPKIINN